MKTKEHMQRVNSLLLKASKAYYMTDKPIMTDREYDTLYDEVVNWEKTTGITLKNSITHQVGYTVVSKLEKEPHEYKALSLNKTKDVYTLVNWTLGNDVVLSWKLDGLTIVATYDDGKLNKAVTRGNGEIGENVTHNAPYFKGLPQTIPYDGHLIVRGEALIGYEAFEKFKDTYSVPRSLASGSVRQLDSKIASQRDIHFKAFELVTPSKETFMNNLDWLASLGFDVVPHRLCPSQKLKMTVVSMEEQIDEFKYPVDGLVCMINDLSLAKRMGSTDKYPNYGLAFKWQDDTYTTIIRDIEWQASRTGRINPVCVFDPVEIDGSTVNRATGNNLSFLHDKGIGVGATVEVYKANMIIPTIDRVTKNPQPCTYPKTCPSCGQPTSVRKGKDGSATLMCENPQCPAKHIEHLTHFVSRDAMNVVGLSKNTLDVLVSHGIVHQFSDLYRLNEHPEIARIDGFGKRSYEKLLDALNQSRNTTLDRVIYAQGIQNIGRHVSKDIAKLVHGDWKQFVQLMDTRFDWQKIDGVGETLRNNLYAWWTPENRNQFIELCSVLNFKESGGQTPTGNNTQPFKGMTFCITGKLSQFKNRNELVAWIENLGGKVSGSVSSKTSCLVNNDTTSQSGKNKKAQSLGIPILSETGLIDLSKK